MIAPETTRESRENKNSRLRTLFTEMGLDVDQVIGSPPGDLHGENAYLEALLRWVIVYRRHPSRVEMEARGYDYPPVYPDNGPDDDWLLFETWVSGKPIRWRYEETFGLLPPPDSLTDNALEVELGKLLENLARKNVQANYKNAVPPRLVYTDLRNYLRGPNGAFEICTENSFTMLGCPAYCPECVQRPWCDIGQEQDWLEDIEAGHRVFPEACRGYLDATSA